MRKITLLFIITIVPFICLGQTFDFTGVDEGFNVTSACSTSAASTFLSVDLNGDASNPNFGTITANVDADTNGFVGVTIKNADASGPTFMRVSYPNDSGGRRFVNLDITAGETDYITYWFDLTNALWAGTENDIKIHFKAAGNVTYVVPTAGVNLEIDKIEFVDAIPPQEREIFNFDTNGDSEGWTDVDATSVVSGGIITITPIEDESSKIVQDVFSVDATANTYIHITYKNNSALNNQFRLQFRYAGDGYTSFLGTNVAINQSMSAFETLDVDLASARPEWTGITQDFQIIVRDTNNDDVNNNAASPGAMEIDSIVFDNNMTLSSEDLDAIDFSIYPNPTDDIIRITTKSQTDSVRIYDITGKLIMSMKFNNSDSLDVSELRTGVYLFNLVLVNGIEITKRLIKK
ncbi:T9SS type A sorting domain-containing protein [Winogradskyella sp. PE311]|uniref:T9SS type A sorting domain-containing protein n=1 Tax=Winogradskyella sp. PE311 TaxID=3366943 RepID=UPI00397EF2FA